MFNINLSEIEAASQAAFSTLQERTSEVILTTQAAVDRVANVAQETTTSVACATAVTAQEAFTIARNLQFQNLSPDLQLKFARAGVRTGIRNIQEAARVYETIPAQIRAQGQGAVRQFLKDKDWSHIRSYVNGGGNEAKNGIFENFRDNRARGGANMTPEELVVARKALADAAFKASIQQIAKASIQAALISAAIELVFSILENALSFAEGKISQEQFIQNVTTSTIKAGITSGMITGILVFICTLCPPIAALLGCVAAPLALLGIGFMCVRAWEILIRANKLFGITEKIYANLEEQFI